MLPNMTLGQLGVLLGKDYLAVHKYIKQISKVSSTISKVKHISKAISSKLLTDLNKNMTGLKF